MEPRILAGLLAAEGQADARGQLVERHGSMRERIGAALPPNLQMLRDRYIESVKTSLGEAQFAIACEDGRAMPLEDAIALARRQAPQP